MWLYPLPALIALCGFVYVVYEREHFDKEVRYAAVLIVLGLIVFLFRSFRRGEFPFGNKVVTNES